MGASARTGLVIAALAVGLWTVAMSADAPGGAAGDPDPVVGAYVLTPDATGTTTKAQAAGCGQCHPAAEVKREASGYVLALTIQQNSSRKTARALKGQRNGDQVVFENAKYLFTAADGRLTGKAKGPAAGTLEMTRQGAASRPATPPATRPASGT